VNSTALTQLAHQTVCLPDVALEVMIERHRETWPSLARSPLPDSIAQKLLATKPPVRVAADVLARADAATASYALGALRESRAKPLGGLIRRDGVKFGATIQARLTKRKLADSLANALAGMPCTEAAADNLLKRDGITSREAKLRLIEQFWPSLSGDALAINAELLRQHAPALGAWIAQHRQGDRFKLIERQPVWGILISAAWLDEADQYQLLEAALALQDHGRPSNDPRIRTAGLIAAGLCDQLTTTREVREHAWTLGENTVGDDFVRWSVPKPELWPVIDRVTELSERDINILLQRAASPTWGPHGRVLQWLELLEHPQLTREQAIATLVKIGRCTILEWRQRVGLAWAQPFLELAPHGVVEEVTRASRQHTTALDRREQASKDVEQLEGVVIPEPARERTVATLSARAARLNPSEMTPYDDNWCQVALYLASQIGDRPGWELTLALLDSFTGTVEELTRVVHSSLA
jgi:hypothetical protein